jgi:hypothetical protein
MTSASKTLTWADISPEAIIQICDYLEGDGHGMYDGKFLLDMNVPPSLIEAVTRKHRAGPGKYAIFVDGKPVKYMKAVYSLDLYAAIARDLGLQPSGMMGRGFAARDYDSRIRDKVKGALDASSND